MLGYIFLISVVYPPLKKKKKKVYHYITGPNQATPCKVQTMRQTLTWRAWVNRAFFFYQPPHSRIASEITLY